MSHLDDGDEPAQSDFCTLDLCDDTGFLTSSPYSVENNGDSEALHAHSRELRSLELHSIRDNRGAASGLKNVVSVRSQDLTNPEETTVYSFSSNALPCSLHDPDLCYQHLSSSSESPTRGLLSSFRSMSGEISEERSRMRSSPIRPASEMVYHRAENEMDFTRIASSRDANIHSHLLASVPDHVSDYGGSERSHTRSRVSAHEDLCNFYSERGSPIDFGALSLADVDHPLDIAWLSDRCDGDVHLLVAVLETFCQQGGNHCNEIGNAVLRGDYDKLCFHTVFYSTSASTWRDSY